MCRHMLMIKVQMRKSNQVQFHLSLRLTLRERLSIQVE
jgi:hypothetical protein